MLSPRWSACQLNSSYEVAGIHVEAHRKPHDRGQARVLLATLESRDLGHVQAGSVRELHLRQARGPAKPPEVDAELLLRLHGRPSSER
jgi:hypothetical protein